MIGWRRQATLCALAVVTCSSNAYAKPRAFNIPRQPLAAALSAFGVQSGSAIVFTGSGVGRGLAPAVVGDYEPEAALARLLRGSDLRFERIGDGYAIVPSGRAPGGATATSPAVPPTGPVAAAPPAIASPALPSAERGPERPAVVEGVVVTGSSIRGLRPVGSAVISLNRTAISAAAPANSKELLSAMPQLGNFGVNAEQSTPNRYRTAGFQPNIHNLGIYATLTLFNGHRMAPVGGEAVFPDPSIIPVIAIERVELVADGASSVYGSDAVAGVVNFIYRKDVEGLEATITEGWNDTRYQKRDVAVAAGRSWAGGRIMAAYEYSANRSPWTSEIPTLALGGDQRSRGGRDLRAANCLEANITVGGVVYAYPTWTVGRNVCGLLAPQGLIADGERHAALVTWRQDVGPRATLWAEANASLYDTWRRGGRQGLNLSLPSTNPFFRSPPGVSADRVMLSRSGLGLFEGAVTRQSSDVYGLTLGADLELGRGWRATSMLHLSRTRDYNDDGELDMLAAQRLANGQTPDTALNPFGDAAANAPDVLRQIDNGYAQTNKASQRLRELQLKADGPLFATPGGRVQAAVGLALRSDQAIQLQTAGPPGPNLLIVRDDDIRRSVMSAFGELSIPLVGEGAARFGLRRLALSISGRYDDYDRLGAVFNPKYGLAWSPMAGLVVRASQGTAFAAPNLGLTTSTFTVPRPNSVLNLTDATTGVFLGTVNALNPGGGNPDLKPEEATTRSFGLDFNPAFAPALRLSASYYAVEYRNTIYTPQNDDILTNPQFAHLRIINPTPAEVAAVLARMPPQAPITTDFDVIVYLNARNIGVRQIAGVDISGDYSLVTPVGDFDLSLSANHQARYRQQVVPDGPFNSRLGAAEAPRWKARAGLAWRRGPFDLTLFANYVSSFRNTTVTPNQRVEANTTYDLSALLRVPGPRPGLEAQVRVVNLFDEAPPFYDSAAGYYAALASPFGRQLELTLRARF